MESPPLALFSSVRPTTNNDKTIVFGSKTPGSKVAEAAAAAAAGMGRRGKGSGVGAAVSTPRVTTRTTRASCSGVWGGGRGRAVGDSGGGSASAMATRSSGRLSIGSIVPKEALTDEVCFYVMSCC